MNVPTQWLYDKANETNYETKIYNSNPQLVLICAILQIVVHSTKHFLCLIVNPDTHARDQIICTTLVGQPNLSQK